MERKSKQLKEIDLYTYYSDFNNAKYHDPRKFYKWITGGYQTRDQGLRMIKTADNKITNEPKIVDQEVSKFYRQLFSAPRTEQADNFPIPADLPDNLVTDERISTKEIRWAINKLKKHKAPGPDRIPNEIWKLIATKPESIAMLKKAFNHIFNEQEIPEEWKKSWTQLLYKKNDPHLVSNYRPIALLDTVQKIYTTILARRLTMHLENDNRLSRAQLGFRKLRSCTLGAGSIISIVEDSKKQQKPVHMIFLDIQKAFDSVYHTKMLEGLQSMGVGRKMLANLKAIYTDCHTEVLHHYGKTPPIKIQRGIRQGCPMSAILFCSRN